MPRRDVPERLRPYAFHGLDLTVRGDEGVGDCPFCGREEKFSVNTGTGLARCLVCNEGSRGGGINPLTFLRKLWEHGEGVTRDEDYSALAADRGLRSAETPRAWGARRSPVTDEWLLPAWSADGRLVQLYRYTGRPGSLVLMATPSGGDVPGGGLFGVPPFGTRHREVHFCEGPWDGMAWWEALGRHAPPAGDGTAPVPVGSPAASYLCHVLVVAVPGAGSFRPEWGYLAAGRRAVLLFDNDHPRKTCRTCKTSFLTTESPVCPACRQDPGPLTHQGGIDGMRRAAGLLAGGDDPPALVHYLRWGTEGDGWSATTADGWDVRDALGRTGGAAGDGRTEPTVLADLLGRISPIPAGWVTGRDAGGVRTGKGSIDPSPCTSWAQLRTAWVKAMRWTPGLDRALSVMLAACASVRVPGDQLWVKVVSPPSGGKSSLCEALNVSRHVVSKSVVRGFHSGYRETRDGAEDNSLVVRLRDKTLVTKDGDTLLQAPNLGQILAEARDVYDRVSRTHYRNKASKDYDGLNLTWILCGTASLRALDDSELGERFLTVRIMGEIDSDLEHEINVRKINQFRALMAAGRGEVTSSADAPEMVTAKRLTGGYIDRLRDTVADVLSITEMDDDAAAYCNSLGKFVAYMRCRQSKKQQEEVHRELSTRLCLQFTKLAYVLAVVRNRPEVDFDVRGILGHVALDTAGGRTFDLTRLIADAGDRGAVTASLAVESHEGDEECRKLLRFLSRIGVAEKFSSSAARFHRPVYRWRLTAAMREIWDVVVGPPPPPAPEYHAPPDGVHLNGEN